MSQESSLYRTIRRDFGDFMFKEGKSVTKTTPNRRA